MTSVAQLALATRGHVLRKYSFEIILLIMLLLYTWLYLTPSSYGKALEILGIPNDGLIYGNPQAVRSDEWSVWTAYLQALVNNDFQRFNANSIYHEDFRNFNALPIHDWALIFKPQFWSFLLFEPARAFSLHHGFLIVAFIIGWKQLINQLLRQYSFATPSVGIGFSLLLFFSGFVQTVWTTMGPIIAFFPWTMLVLLNWQSHSIGYYLSLAYITATWLLSQTYPPLVVSFVYIAIYLLGVYQTDFFRNPKRLVYSGIAFLAGVAVVIYYYEDVIRVMMNTVYPGQRVSVGGEDGVHFWLSTIVPYMLHSTDKIFVPSLNACEVTAASSFLPLICLCFSNIRSFSVLRSKEVLILSTVFLLFSAWMTLPVPLIIGKVLLLTKIPGHRLAFFLGFTINILALTLLVKHGVKLTLMRVTLFTVLLFACWSLPVYFGWIAYSEKSTFELIMLPLVILLWLLQRFHVLEKGLQLPCLVGIALLPNMLYFATFNPVQSSRTIFSAKDSEQVAMLKQLEQEDSRGWLIFPGVPAAILNGLGLKSFSHTLIQPQLKFFRPYFPELSDTAFNQIFNRYAHVHLFDIAEPDSPALDVIRFPLRKVLQQHGSWKVGLTEAACTIHAETSGNIDALNYKNNKLFLSGWELSNEHHYLTNLKAPKVISYIEMPRIDIALFHRDKHLLYSGFSLELQLSDEDIRFIRENGFCLYSVSTQYGIKQLFNYSSADVKGGIQVGAK